MIDVILRFPSPIRKDKLVVTQLPALPRDGESFTFEDSDRKLKLHGIVTDVAWEEVDGDLSIVVTVENLR